MRDVSPDYTDALLFALGMQTWNSAELERAAALMDALIGIEWFIHAATYENGHKCLRRNRWPMLRMIFPVRTARERLARTWTDPCDVNFDRVMFEYLRHIRTKKVSSDTGGNTE